jgi:hypothetical protein
MSPDENAAMQIRVFKAGQGFTTALLAQVYEENMLPAGAQKLSLDDHTTTNGIPCKKGVYLLNYNGVEVGLSAIYIVQKGNGYVVTALIPANMIQQKGDELTRVMKSFTIDGFSAPVAKQEKKPSGLGGLLGGTRAAGKNEVTISGNGMNGTYKFNKSDSYPMKSSETVVVKGIDNSGTNAFVLYMYNNKGVGTFTYGLMTSGKPTFAIGAVNGKALDGSPDGSSTGLLTVTEYQEGGMIKGDFTANVKGRNIKGSFSLPLQQLNNTSSNVKVAAGRYNFISRSDGKVFVSYHYMFVESDGNFYEEYQRTNAGNYVSKTHGTWTVKGNKFIVKHNNSSVVDTYTIRGNELLWETDSGVVSIFRLQ